MRRSPSLRFGKPVKLFEGDYFTDIWTGFLVGKDPASGADRFLMVLPLPESIPERLRVVVGWGEKVGL